MKILFFGDSITRGYDDSEGGWVHRLRIVFGDKYTFVNSGVPGDSSFDVLSRISNEDEELIDTNAAVVIAVGVNDARIRNGHHFTEVEDYTRNLDKIYLQAKKISKKILFIGLTPCDEILSMPVDWDDTIYKNSRIEMFNDALRDFCKSNNVAFVEIFEPFKNAMKDMALISDGVHPNEEGHQLIADLVKPSLQKLINT